LRKKGHATYWCDGIYGEAYFIDEDPPRILGHAWICEGNTQDEWRFELYLPHRVTSRKQIDWVQLLPPINVTKWLAIDECRKLIQIEPAAAIPDLPK
jgi:hypothetical protein